MGITISKSAKEAGFRVNPDIEVSSTEIEAHVYAHGGRSQEAHDFCVKSGCQLLERGECSGISVPGGIAKLTLVPTRTDTGKAQYEGSDRLGNRYHVQPMEQVKARLAQAMCLEVSTTSDAPGRDNNQAGPRTRRLKGNGGGWFSRRR